MGCMKLYGHFHITPEPGQGPRPIVPHCWCPGQCSCLGPGSVQSEYTTKAIFMQQQLVYLSLSNASLSPLSSLRCSLLCQPSGMLMSRFVVTLSSLSGSAPETFKTSCQTYPNFSSTSCLRALILREFGSLGNNFCSTLLYNFPNSELYCSTYNCYRVKVRKIWGGFWVWKINVHSHKRARTSGINELH